MISILDSLPPGIAYLLCASAGFFIGAITAIVAIAGNTSDGAENENR